MKRNAKKDLEMCEKATSGKWVAVRWGKDDQNPYTPNDLKQLLCDMVDKTENHGDSVKWFFGIHSSIDDDGTPVSPAITGKGPTSENNAIFIAESREALPYWINRAVKAEELLREVIRDQKGISEIIIMTNSIKRFLDQEEP